MGHIRQAQFQTWIDICIGGGTGGAGGALAPPKSMKGGIAPTPSVAVACQHKIMILVSVQFETFMGTLS